MKQREITEPQKKVLESYGLSRYEIKEAAVLEYGRGEFLCIEGEALPHLLLILGGDAKVCATMENGKSLLLCFYHAGGMIGELEFMLNADKARTSVQAVTGVRGISIPFRSNRSVLRSNPVLLNHIGAALARKLDRCSKNSACMVSYPLECRLCSYILSTSKAGYFTDKLTEVSELLGTSYRNLLRALHKLCSEGILEKRERGYYIRSDSALHENARDFYEPVENQTFYPGINSRP